MPAAISSFFLTLIALLIVVDPIPVAPMFAAMTAGKSKVEVRAIARRASVAGALLLLFFTLFGGLLFKALRIELGAFRAAGGLLLLLTALDMLRARVSECRCTPRELKEGAAKDDISIVPLATPMLAGPGAIATVMMLVSERPGVGGTLSIVAAVAITFVASYVVLRVAPLIGRLLGTSGTAMFQRIMGLLLAAMAVQFIADGVRRLLSS
jgi:multiple antibiotic resistance protein